MKHSKLLALSICFGVSFGFQNAAMPDKDSSQKLLDEVVVQIKKKQFDKAFEIIEEAVASNPSDELLLERCVLALRIHTKDRSRAILLCSRIIDKLPDNATAYRLRMISYFENDEREQALSDLKKIEELEPNKVETHLAKSTAFNHMGLHRRAADSISNAIGLEPQNAYLYILRGNEYFASKSYLKARNDFKKALSLNANSVRDYGFPAGMLEVNLSEAGYIPKRALGSSSRAPDLHAIPTQNSLDAQK